jgi:hypothetical protein
MTNETALKEIEHEMKDLLIQLSFIQDRIREKLITYSDGKNLKGNEIVGWLGEIYGKMLFNGQLVSDREEHDLVTPEKWRISVKARKGWGTNWKQTSAIPKIEGEDCPTHLLFVHLNDDYSVDRMWLFIWKIILGNSRFTEHIVRGSHRSFIFKVDDQLDKEFLVYSKTTDEGITEHHQKQNSIISTVTTKNSNEERIKSTTKNQALIWLNKNHPMDLGNILHASKFHPDQEIWFFTLPTTYFNQNNVGNINILCENQTKGNEFYFLKVPFSFFRENQEKFAIRKKGAKFDLHISAKKRNWMIDERSNIINFSRFVVGKN